MEHINGGKVAFAAFFTALGTALGWLGWLAVLFVGCMGADYISGSAAALKRGEWSSAVARAGLWHKAGEIIAVTVAAVTDCLVRLLTEMSEYALIELPFEYTALICPLVLVWYILTELGSIIENAGQLTDNIPPFLTKMIAVLKNTAAHKWEDK